LTDVAALGRPVRNWRARLRHGLEAGDTKAEGEALAELIEARLRTGRPLAAADWIADQEAGLARPLAPQRPGPKPRARGFHKNHAP
jgi:putative transposase